MNFRVRLNIDFKSDLVGSRLLQVLSESGSLDLAEPNVFHVHENIELLFQAKNGSLQTIHFPSLMPLYEIDRDITLKLQVKHVDKIDLSEKVKFSLTPSISSGLKNISSIKRTFDLPNGNSVSADYFTILIFYDNQSLILCNSDHKNMKIIVVNRDDIMKEILKGDDYLID